MGFLIYASEVLDSLGFIMGVVGTIGLIGLSIGTAIMLIEENANGLEKGYHKKMFKFIVLSGVLTLLACFCPSQKTLLAAYVVPELVQSQAVQKLPDQVSRAIDVWVESITKTKGDKK